MTAPLFTAFNLVVVHVNVLDGPHWMTEMFFLVSQAMNTLFLRCSVKLKEVELLKLKVDVNNVCSLHSAQLILLRCF